MAGYKLFRLLKMLDKEELPEVGKFLASPFHNKDLACARLFGELRKFHPEMEHPRLTKEYLYGRVYDGEPYNDGKMRKLLSSLGGLLERYLAWRELDRSEEDKSRMLVRALGMGGDYGLFKDAAEQRLKELENGAQRGGAYFREKAELNRAVYFHPETGKATVRHDYLQAYIENLEHWFTIAAFQNGAECLLRDRVVNLHEVTLYVNAAEELAATAGMKAQPVLKLFHQIFLLYKGKAGEAELPELTETCFQCFRLMDEMEKQLALKLLINYATKFSNKGSREHTRFMFDLYKIGVESNLHLTGKNVISPESFLNIAITAASAGEFDYARSFLESNMPLLPESERENVKTLCEASFDFQHGLATGEMEAFVDAVEKTSYILPRSWEIYDLRVRSLDLRCEFELFLHKKREFERIMDLATNFERHLSKNKTYAEAKKEAYLRFIHFLKTLTRLANNPNAAPESFNRFLEEIGAEENLLFSHWLKEKAEELRQSPRRW